MLPTASLDTEPLVLTPHLDLLGRGTPDSKVIVQGLATGDASLKRRAAPPPLCRTSRSH